MTWNPASGALSDPWAALNLTEIAGTDMTANITDNFNALRAALYPSAIWTATWTSSGTTPGIGNGSYQGVYSEIGKFVVGQATVSLGSTSTVGSGNYFFALPVTAATGYALDAPVGQISFLDTSASQLYTRTLCLISSTLVAAFDASGGVLSATAPVVPANGDKYLINLTYLAA